MSHKRRTVLGRARRQKTRKAAALRSRNRLGNIERLEDRVLLAADFNPWHNYALPPDVNGDFVVTPMDALHVINALNGDGAEQMGMPLGGEAEAWAPAPLMFDVNNDGYLTPMDVLQIINYLNAEGESPAPMVQVRGRIAEDIAPDPPQGPAGRETLTAVNPGETFRLEVYAQDIRTFDGQGGNNFGVFAFYADTMFDDVAFTIPPGQSNNWPGKPVMPFPVSFQDPNVQLDGPLLIFSYPYQNGPRGDITSAPGLVNNTGGFREGFGAPGKAEAFIYDVLFQVESIVAFDDELVIQGGGSQSVDVLANDTLVQGQRTFSIGDPNEQFPDTGIEVLVFGDTGFGSGAQPGQTGSIVPWSHIDVINPVVHIPLGDRVLQVQSFQHDGQKGTVEHLGDGEFRYTPIQIPTKAEGPLTDTFTYVLFDGVSVTQTATVTVTIMPENQPPVIAAPDEVAIDERNENEPGKLLFGPGAVSITDADDEPLRVTLVTDAPIQVPAVDGLDVDDGKGADGRLVLVGSQNQVNAAMAGLTYKAQQDFYHADGASSTLKITAEDLANGVSQTEVHHTVTIAVRPINDPPTLEVPSDIVAVHDAVGPDLTVSIAGIEVGDEVDAQFAPGGDVEGRLTLASSGGTLAVAALQGLVVTGNNSDNVVIRGLTAEINAAVANVQFTAPVGSYIITATMNDLGNVDYRQSQEDVALEVQDEFLVTIVPPQRPFAVPDSFQILEDTANHEFEVLLNDFNFDSETGGANLQITEVSDPANGTVQITGNQTTVTYTPVANFFGTDTFTYTIVDTVNEGDGPSTATVTVNVILVNDQPTFTAVDPPTINEDAGPQTVTDWATFDAGTPQENAVQSVKQYDVQVLANPDNLFAVNPNVDTAGTLRYTPADDAFGEATFRARVQDDGGTENDGIDTSEWQTFTITVLPVNDPPSFSASDPPEVNEDSGPQVIENWAHDFVPGPPNESDQQLEEYLVVNVGNPDLFAVLPSVDLDGTLTYTPADDAFGNSTFTVVARDDGGTDRGGDDTSAPQTFAITVLPVNDPPSFQVAQTEITVRENEGLQTMDGWVTEFIPGPPNESDQQVLRYIVNDITNPNLFEVPPSVSVDGTLTFQSAMNVGGTSQFTVAVQDDGGTERGGIDISAPKTITINVTAVNDPPVNRLNGDPIEAGDVVFTSNDFDLAFTAANSARLTVTDPDIADNDDTFATFTVDLSVTDGLLLLGEGDDPAATKQLSTLTLAGVNQALGTLIFRPDAGFIGEAVLTITTNDGGTFGDPPDDQPLETSSTLIISVAPMNRPPIARDDQVEMPEGGVAEFNVLDNDSAGPNEDAFQSIRVISFDTASTQGTVELLNAETGVFRYTPPDPHFNGQTTFSYTIQDDGQSMIDGVIVDDFKTDSAVVTITVWEVNDPPIANDDLVLIDPQPAVGQQFRFDVSELLANDLPGPPNESDQTLTIISVTTSAKGASVVLDGDEVVYTVPEGFDHVDTFEYTVQDDGTTRGEPDFKTDTATVTVRDVVLSSVAGYVYIDLDGDGQKDEGEPGIAGVRIQLSGTDLMDTPFVHETVTDDHGRYKFTGVLPSQAGTSYTISQPQQPAGMKDGSASPGNGATVSNPNEIGVHVPLIGFGADPNNSITDNNNFGELGLAAEFTSINPYRSLLWSEINGTDPVLASGWLFATDAAGNLQWHINIGGWQYYVPGQSVDADSQHYRVQINQGSMWVTDRNADVERWLSVDLSSGRMRQLSANGNTIHHIIGSPDLFDLPSYDPPDTSSNGGGSGGLFSGEGEADQYAQAVDALFAAYD